MDSYRLFNCGRCHVQVRICRSCDRGNIYCPGCAPKARPESRRRSGAKYQSKEQGRLNHAARQQRYLDHKDEREKMTQQGSKAAEQASLLQAQPEVAQTSVLKKEEMHAQHQAQNLSQSCEPRDPAHGPAPELVLCHFCGRTCGPFARLDFLRTPRRRTARDVDRQRGSSPATVQT